MWPTSDKESDAAKPLFSESVEAAPYNHWILEWGGCACGVIGAFLVSASAASLRFDGFILFAASNLLLGTWAFKRKAYGILAMQCIYTVATVIGLINNLK